MKRCLRMLMSICLGLREGLPVDEVLDYAKEEGGGKGIRGNHI